VRVGTINANGLHTKRRRRHSARLPDQVSRCERRSAVMARRVVGSERLSLVERALAWSP
jgi:hypothetical protein